jgi:hypothetical protein
VLLAAVLALFARDALVQSPARRTLLVIIAGVGGDPAYGERFLHQGAALRDAAVSRLAVADSDVVFLAEDPARDVQRVRLASTKANVERVMSETAARARPNDEVVVVLIGHGSAGENDARFNLPGPDISAKEMDALLAKLPTTHVALVNASSASGDWLPVLAKRDRVIITATKSGFEKNETMFAKFFVDAFTKDGADADKDGRISLLEAFTYAKREVARAYEGERRLLTEHAQLDDDGDGKGAVEPDGRAEGQLARATFIGGATLMADAAAASADPKVRELAVVRDRAAARVDSLRLRKASMDSTAYEHELEKALLELSRATQALRLAEGKK